MFGYTNILCVALQKKDQDIVSAMRLVDLTKVVLQKMREDGWETHLKKIISFCNDNDIVVPDMEACYIPQGRSMRFVQQVSYVHHFRVDVFIEVIDLLLQELDNRFDEVNMELLRCMACLNPKDCFSSFDKEKLVETKRHVAYPLVFLLIKLVLILPFATANVERVFSGMTFVKNKLRNSMGDQFLNDCLVTSIEKEMFLQISDEKIVNRFREMKTRRIIN